VTLRENWRPFFVFVLALLIVYYLMFKSFEVNYFLSNYQLLD